MSYKKREITRAIDEFIESVNNLTASSTSNYTVRLKQLFNLIKSNPILNTIVNPYLQMDFDDSKVGFITTPNGRLKYIIPEDEDIEISLILKVLNNHSENNKNLEQTAFSIYMAPSPSENLSLFQNNIIIPAFNKLLLKMKYLLEDVEEMKDEIDNNSIQIIKGIKIDATHSMVAIGSNITQSMKENIFDSLSNEITQKIADQETKKELLELVSQLKLNQNNKESFKELYDKFLLKIGTYMNIIGPFLPLLVKFFE